MVSVSVRRQSIEPSDMQKPAAVKTSAPGAIRDPQTVAIPRQKEGPKLTPSAESEVLIWKLGQMHVIGRATFLQSAASQYLPAPKKHPQNKVEAHCHRPPGTKIQNAGIAHQA